MTRVKPHKAIFFMFRQGILAASFSAVRFPEATASTDEAGDIFDAN
jgi:hypothetical protein